MSERRVTVFSLDRLDNSPSGNPRYKIHTEDGPYTTSSDAGFCYGIENRRARGAEAQDATLVLTSTGRVRDMTWHPLIGDRFPDECDHDREICADCYLTCNPCGTPFDTAEALQEHVRVTHVPTDEYACKHCGRPYGH
jgi:hypothetical protein